MKIFGIGDKINVDGSTHTVLKIKRDRVECKDQTYRFKQVEKSYDTGELFVNGKNVKEK